MQDENIQPMCTKYEIARIIGIRATMLQLAIDIPADSCSTATRVITTARGEAMASQIPASIRRAGIDFEEYMLPSGAGRYSPAHVGRPSSPLGLPPALRGVLGEHGRGGDGE
jgi:DNA-directed RNA polymerase subunit K/omega